MREEDPTIATVLEAQGYATGQFGKNHLGDRDEHLPTNHGFDEFFGNLYHLNAEEEPENEDHPGDMLLENGKTFQEQYSPRGVIPVVMYSTDYGPHMNTWPDGDLTALRYEDWKLIFMEQKAASFSLDQVMNKLTAPAGAH
jgi:hypothetical protein